MSAEDLVVMTPDAAVAAAVDGALGSNGRAWSRTTVHSPRELLQQMSRTSPPLVLVDLDPDPRHVLAEVERLSIRFPAARFVALSRTLESELLLGAMQSGVRHVVLKQSISADLAALMHRLSASGTAASAGRSDVFAVLSAAGGSGATTLAVNLADEVGAAAGQPALLIDLDLAYGAVATHLGVESKYGLDYLLSHASRIDTHLVKSAAARGGDNVHVLPSPASINFSWQHDLPFDRLGQLIDAAAQGYSAVVIDAPRLTMERAATLASRATSTLLAFQLTVKDVRIARQMVAALAERGISLDTVVPVVTRYAKRHHMISLDEASKALGGLELAVVRNDYHIAAQAINFGQTLARSAPRSVLRKDVQELARKLVAVAPAR